MFSNKKNIKSPILEKIQRADREHSMFDGCSKILTGLSGGADSTCLLLSLKELSDEYGFSLYALHVNHGIRGKEADRDEEFARNLCAKYGIQFFCEHIDVPALSVEKGISAELCARDERYRLFEEYCKKYDIGRVAVAHNACDNAETVLFNLIRGSSIKGLCGIPPKRELCEGVQIIRPLIYAERYEIEDYLKEIGQDYVTDSTNQSDDYSRNYIRHNIVPAMAKMNPSLYSAFSRTSDLTRADAEFLDKIAENSLTCDVSKLCELDECILSRVIVKLFSRESSSMPEEKHIKALCAKIYSYKNRNSLKCRVSFPDKKAAFIENGILSFCDDVREKMNYDKYRTMLSEGFNKIGGTDYLVYVNTKFPQSIPQNITQFEENIYKIYTTDYLYFDKIQECLFVRNRLDGDSILSSGLNKRIKALMSKAKLSEKERALLPLLCSENSILLLPGICTADSVKCKKQNESNMQFVVYKLQKQF